MERLGKGKDWLCLGFQGLVPICKQARKLKFRGYVGLLRAVMGASSMARPPAHSTLQPRAQGHPECSGPFLLVEEKG